MLVVRGEGQWRVVSWPMEGCAWAGGIVLGALFLADVELFGSGLALGEGVAEMGVSWDLLAMTN